MQFYDMNKSLWGTPLLSEILGQTYPNQTRKSQAFDLFQNWWPWTA